MKTHLLIAIVALAFAGGLASAQSPTTKIAAQKGWLNDLNAGKAQALKTGKPMLVVFRCDP